MLRRCLVLAALTAPLLAAASDPATLAVEAPWVRATVEGQTTAAAYMTVTAPAAATLVEVATPLTTSVEIHEMKMDGDVMRMRAVGPLPLPAGRKVEFKPGGYHLMLMGLRHGLKAGDVVPMTLDLQWADGRREQVQLRAPVK